MMNENLKMDINKVFSTSVRTLTAIFVSLFAITYSFSQEVNATIDSTSIKIGEQITYSIQVETDSTNVVVFPEGQTFAPMEMVESLLADTTRL